MLHSLHINHYALIDRLDIDFTEGYSVITGETGAGKSIILGALGLLLGQRADAKAIKSGEKKCSVEGSFQIEGLHLEQLFQENDIDFDSEECIIRREVSATGKSRAFINDTPVSLNTLKSITSQIIDIHSQHQNLLMGNEHFLIDTLDTVGHLENVRTEYFNAFKEWTHLRKHLENLRQQAQQDRSELDYMQYQLQQLEEAQLEEGEQEKLEEEAEVLNHTEDIKQSLFTASNLINGEEQNTISALRSGIQLLESIRDIFKPANELAERLESVRIELKDIVEELEQAQERMDFDPERLSFVNERLNLIYTLQNKHRVENITALLNIANELREKIDSIENIDEHIAEYEEKEKSLHLSMIEKGRQLTASRIHIANDIATELIHTLQNMGMPEARLHFEISERVHPDASGLDNVRFLFNANKNAAEQDVAQIASGGEIARLMLALKSLISKYRNLPTIIFDEIDTGVSGTIAEKMAHVMLAMAQNCQVLCITHLPQIAAMGTNHYKVYKTNSPEGTSSHIIRLTKDERIKEIANMLSGEVITEAAINNAKSLLRL